MLHMSTDCPDDLEAMSSAHVRFERPSVAGYCPSPPILKHAEKWFIGSSTGCSCTFRHLSLGAQELGFGEPEDWFPEEQDEIDGTLELYDMLKGLVERGHQVELFDSWNGEVPPDLQKRTVSFSEVPGTHFRLFENTLFTLTA